MAAASRKVSIELVPEKFVNVTQLERFVETCMYPFKPADNCRLYASPFVFIGIGSRKASCNLKVLLDNTLNVLVAE